MIKKEPTNNVFNSLGDFKMYAHNKQTKQTELVLLICFVNRYVDVMPESELEGGNQVSWSFDDITLAIK